MATRSTRSGRGSSEEPVYELRREGRTFRVSLSNLTTENVGLIFGVSYMNVGMLSTRAEVGGGVSRNPL